MAKPFHVRRTFMEGSTDLPQLQTIQCGEVARGEKRESKKLSKKIKKKEKMERKKQGILAGQQEKFLRVQRKKIQKQIKLERKLQKRAKKQQKTVEKMERTQIKFEAFSKKLCNCISPLIGPICLSLGLGLTVLGLFGSNVPLAPMLILGTLLILVGFLRITIYAATWVQKSHRRSMYAEDRESGWNFPRPQVPIPIPIPSPAFNT